MENETIQKEAILRAIDERIENVKSVIAWRKRVAEAYFETFKKFVAEKLTVDGVAAGHLDSRIQEVSNAYNCWALAEAELNQLKAFKEDIEKGRVEFHE